MRRRQRFGVLVEGEQLIDRDPVETGQALQPGHRDGPLAPLVGAQHRRLELLVRLGLDLLERQALLAADTAQALADLAAVAVCERLILVIDLPPSQ